METLTLDLAKKIMDQQHITIAGMRDLSLRYSRLHQEIQDVLRRNGSISESDYRLLYFKAFDGFKAFEDWKSREAIAEQRRG